MHQRYQQRFPVLDCLAGGRILLTLRCLIVAATLNILACFAPDWYQVSYGLQVCSQCRQVASPEQADLLPCGISSPNRRLTIQTVLGLLPLFIQLSAIAEVHVLLTVHGRLLP